MIDAYLPLPGRRLVGSLSTRRFMRLIVSSSSSVTIKCTLTTVVKGKGGVCVCVKRYYTNRPFAQGLQQSIINTLWTRTNTRNSSFPTHH